MSKLSVLREEVMSHELRAKDAIFVPSITEMNKITQKLSYKKPNLTVGYVYKAQSERIKR